MTQVVNPEQDQEIRRLWDLGLSASQIGRRLGRTKNAIIGRAHRIGCPNRAQMTLGGNPLTSETAEKAKSMLRDGMSNASVSRIAGIALKTAARLRANLGIAPHAGPRRTVPALDQLTTQAEPSSVLPMFWVAPVKVKKYATVKPGSCCYPIGQPGNSNFRFCNGDSEPGLPYCHSHCCLAYTTYRKRVAA
jgi:GcrA cell cycle regulator